MANDLTPQQTTDKLVGELRALPQSVFDKIKATVDGNTPILVGKWMGYVGEQLCGCLMCDGAAQIDPEGAASITGEDCSFVEDYLNEFYGDVMVVDYNELPRAFDAWAGVHPNVMPTRRSVQIKQYEGGSSLIRIVSDGGRLELREIFAQVAKSRS